MPAVALPRRLGSINKPNPRQPRRGPNRPPKPTNAIPTCPQCKGHDTSEEDGRIICLNCAIEIADANIVAEVQFNEEAGGRSTVQGGTVQENARHAKTLGGQVNRRLGGGEKNSIADIEAAGRRHLSDLTHKLGIEDTVYQQALQLWSLAAKWHFSTGRRTEEVVGACLYGACRRQRTNKILMMDIAEHQKINVFRLGDVYKALCKELYWNDEHIGHQYLVEVEPLIRKYCDQLQFREATATVAEDALKIIRRMNRDWIVSGRHPAGLCGACIILAARMNNFQRSVREIVFVSKVADITIAKRIEEFRRTKSAALTVSEFRESANRMRYQHDPPSMGESERQQERMRQRRLRREAHMASTSQSRATSVAISDAGSTPGPSTMDEDEQTQGQTVFVRDASPENAMLPTPSSSEPLTRKRKRGSNDAESSVHARQAAVVNAAVARLDQQTARIDADGFAIPAIPIDPALNDAGSTTSSKRGRRKKTDDPPQVTLSEEELDAEDWLEQQMEVLIENSEVQEAKGEVEVAKEEERIRLEGERARALAEEQQRLDAQRAQNRREAEGQGDFFGEAPSGEEVTNEELEAEFANDPEVAHCLLSEQEVRFKEQIWVAHNEDWLRKQAEKRMLDKIHEATGQPRKPVRRNKDGTERARRAGKKRSRMGDRTVITEAETPIATPADAAAAMIAKRAPLKSQHIDFDTITRIYGRKTPSVASSVTGSREGTPAASVAASEAGDETQAQSPEAEGDEADEEEDEETIERNRLRQLEQEADEEDTHDFRRAMDFSTAGADEDEFGALGGDVDDEYEYGDEEYD